MRIVHVVSYFQPIMGYQEYFLAKEQIKAGHEVLVITSDRYFPFPDYNRTTFEILGNRFVGTGDFVEEGVPVKRLPVAFEKSARIWHKGLLKAVKEWQADVIISHGMFNFHSMRIVFSKISQNTKLVIDDHVTQNLVRPGLAAKFAYWFFRKFLKATVEKKAWKIVGVYQNTVDLLVKNMGFSRSKVQWISMGSDTSHFFPNTESREAFRKKLGLQNEIVTIYTGKINESKQVHLLIECLNKDRFKKMPKCLLIIGGVAESYKAKWEQALNNANFKVIYYTPVKGAELANWYNAADIAAWPAHTTISSLDAAACGCAIICPDYMNERVANNNGIGIKEGDNDALSDALYLMYSKPLVLDEMKANSVAYIRNNLNWEVISKEFIS